MSFVKLSDMKMPYANLQNMDFRGAILQYTQLNNANLQYTNFTGADLQCADLSNADLSYADLSYANLGNAQLIGANLSNANLTGANLNYAHLKDADLSGANLKDANLKDADLSGVKGVFSQIDFLAKNFERTTDGYIAYKTFGSFFNIPARWKITPGNMIEEVVNYDRTNSCGSGINVATLTWVKEHTKSSCIWKVLIRWEWLSGVCVPYNSDGKIRCEKIKLIEQVNR